eukprot:9641422-Ditylum_brightwellii.AAC.1
MMDFSIMSKDLSQYIENNQFICGNPIFPKKSNNPIAGNACNRINLSCSSPIRKEHYNPKDGQRK